MGKYNYPLPRKDFYWRERARLSIAFLGWGVVLAGLLSLQ